MAAGCVGGDGDGGGTTSGGDGSDGGGGGDGGDGGGNGGDGGDGGANTAEVHVLTDYSSDPWQSKWEDEIKPGFEEQYSAPLNVEYTGLQGTGENRLTTLIQSGKPPEMFHGTITQVADLIAQGQTIPVDDLVGELTEANGELMAASSISTGGEAHIVPHGLYLGGCLNYRQDIYDALGLSVPTTWDELMENARAIDEAEDIDAAGFAVPAQPAGKAGSDFSNWLYNAGGDVWKWADEDETTVELDFAEEDVKNVLRMVRDIAEYSPDPSSLNWGSTIQNWVGGRIGQCFMNNAWLAGPAYRAGVMPVAMNTRQALIPLMEKSLDPIDRGWALMDGTPILSGADNQEGAKNLARYMYGSPSKQADKNLIEPMRFLPPYRDVIESDEYQSAEIFQAEDGHFLDLNKHCVEELAPHLGGDRPSTPASLYAGRFNIDAQMINAVVVQGQSIDQAYSEAREKYQNRLSEGQNL